MALKVCNVCTARWYSGDTCPECLQTGRGEIRDYHFSFEEGAEPTVEPAEADLATTQAGIGGEQAQSAASQRSESVAEGQAGTSDSQSTNPDDLDSEGRLDTGDDDGNGEDLSEHSRNHLSRLARERGLDPSGTKDELLARLQGTAQG